MDEPESPKRTQTQIERWLSKNRAAWRDGYDFLMSTKPNIRYYDALLAVWCSVGKKDRGMLRTQQDFADFVGVSRAVTYQWMSRRPEILEWARELVELRFSSTRVADVDEKVYQKAAGTKSQPAWVKLFYQRAGILMEEMGLHHMGADDGPVEFKRASEMTDEQLATIAAGSCPGDAEAA